MNSQPAQTTMNPWRETLRTRVVRLAGRCSCGRLDCTGAMFHVLVDPPGEDDRWPEAMPPAARRLGAAVAAHYGVNPALLVKARSKPHMRGRQILVYFLREEGYGAMEIGRWFGLHHSTIIHGHRRGKARLHVRDEIAIWEAFRASQST